MAGGAQGNPGGGGSASGGGTCHQCFFLSVSQAFYLTTYTDARSLELLLATIFQPHNSYCVHVDAKVTNIQQMSNISPKHSQASPQFRRTVQRLLSCYMARFPDTYIGTSSRYSAPASLPAPTLIQLQPYSCPTPALIFDPLLPGQSLYTGASSP